MEEQSVIYCPTYRESCILFHLVSTNNKPNITQMFKKVTRNWQIYEYIALIFVIVTPLGTQRSYDYANPTWDLLDMLPEELQLKVQDCLLNFKRVELGTMIGQGKT